MKTWCGSIGGFLSVKARSQEDAEYILNQYLASINDITHDSLISCVFDGSLTVEDIVEEDNKDSM